MAADFKQAFPILTEQLGLKHVETLLQVAQVAQVAPGAAVTQDLKPVRALYLILEGVFTVTIQEGKQSILLGRLGQGQWIGEVSLLSGEPAASSSVTAETAGRLLVLKQEDFERLKHDHAETAAQLVRVLSHELVERLRASAAELVPTQAGGLALPGGSEVHEEKPARDGLLTALQKILGVQGAGRAA